MIKMVIVITDGGDGDDEEFFFTTETALNMPSVLMSEKMLA